MRLARGRTSARDACIRLLIEPTGYRIGGWTVYTSISVISVAVLLGRFRSLDTKGVAPWRGSGRPAAARIDPFEQ